MCVGLSRLKDFYGLETDLLHCTNQNSNHEAFCIPLGVEFLGDRVLDSIWYDEHSCYM